MATRRAATGDAVAQGYDYDESLKGFVLGANWTRDEAATMARLVRVGATVNAEQVAAWSDEQLQTVDLWALDAELNPPGASFPPDVPLIPTGDGGADTQSGAEGGADTTTTAENGQDTTTAPEGGDETTVADDTATGSVLGGQGDDSVAGNGAADTVVAGEGADTVAAADAGRAADAEGGGADTAAAGSFAEGVEGALAGDAGASPVIYPEALTALRAMGDHRYGLYRFPGATPVEESRFGVDGPEYAGDVIRDLVDAGLAEVDLTGGAHGSAKVTAQGYAVLKTGPAPA